MKKIWCILICFAALLITTSCGIGSKTRGIKKLVIVVEKGVDKSITKQLKDLAAKVEEETGVIIPIETSGKYDKIKGTTEILIGKTEREVSKKAYEALPARGYLMKYADDSVVIAGTNDAMLSYAIAQLQAQYIDGGIDLRDIKKLDQDSNDKKIITVVENGVSNYAVAVSEECDCAMSKSSENNGIDVEVNYMFQVMDIIEENIDDYVQHTTYFEKDEKRFEILIGDTGREEFAEAKKQWKINEYGVQCLGNKIVVGGWNLETVSLAGEAFVELLNMATVKERNGKTAIYFIEDQLACLSTDQWMTDIPSYEGGVLSGTNDAAWGQLMWYITDTNETEFQTYCKKLEEQGYEPAISNENVGNLYGTYVKGDRKIHAYYTACDKTVRIIDGSIKKTGLVKDDVISDKKVNDFSVLQLPLSYETKGGGMSYVITLEDGRFVIIDGGNSILKDAMRLYEVLEKSNKRTDGIVIAGWFISHEHDDHYGVLEKFLSKYGKKVKVENVYCSTPSESYRYNSLNPTNFMTIDFPQIAERNGSIPITVVHTGQKFKIGNADFEILYTTEDLYPERLDFFNDASVIVRVSTEDGNVLFLADAADKTSDVLCRRYGSYLRSDVVQMGHHGWNGATYELYETVQPKLILWPNSRKEYEKCSVGDNPAYHEINRKVIALVGEKNIYIADGCVWQLKFPCTECTVFMQE